MYATGFTKPELDERPFDWKLLDARENGSYTYLRFFRRINTCGVQDYANGVSYWSNNCKVLHNLLILLDGHNPNNLGSRRK